jgi:DNA-binding NarL/FixJ family response regulator
MSSEIARKVVRSFAGEQDAGPRDAVLSGREEEVLSLLAQGLLYKEIAAALHLGIPTVSTYVRRIYEKLHVRSRGQASAKFFKDQSDRRAQAH